MGFRALQRDPHKIIDLLLGQRRRWRVDGKL